MKVSQMIKNLEEFMETYGDLECWYAVDDEGNDYKEVYYDPSLYYVDEEENVYGTLDDVEYNDLSEEDVRKICLVN